MKLTNATIYDIIGAVNKFNNAKGKTAFILFRTLRKLNEEIKDCDEQKNKLIQKYGKEVEGGGIAAECAAKAAALGLLHQYRNHKRGGGEYQHYVKNYV